MTARRAAILVATVALALALSLIAVGWYYAGAIRAGALQAKPPSGPRYEVGVVAADRRTLTLERRPYVEGVTAPGVWGVRGRDGYGQVAAIKAAGSGRVVRRYRHLAGSRPRAGDEVAIEATAFPDDPRTALGLPFEAVRYRSDAGPTPAWLVPGSRRTWMIFVHGFNASRREALRLLGPVAREGFPALVISYRNDPEAPRTAGGLREWGRTEWRDVEGAVRYALEHGASEVALVGYSMGGAVVTSFLYESELAHHAAGAVLDSPALDLSEVIELESRRRRLPVVGGSIPPFLPDVARTIASWRFGVDWDRVDYVSRARELESPVLVLHGTADSTVPLATSAAFAAARPDLVRLVRFPGAGHVRAWNVYRRRYERLVLRFAERVSRAAPG